MIGLETSVQHIRSTTAQKYIADNSKIVLYIGITNDHVQRFLNSSSTDTVLDISHSRYIHIPPKLVSFIR